VGEAFKYSNTMGNKIPAEESLMDFIRKNVRSRVQKASSTAADALPTGRIGEDDPHDPENIEKRVDLILSMAGMWGPYVGSETARQSLRFLWLEECLEGENLFCAGTYSKVLAVVSKPAQEGANIKFGHTAVRIHGREQSDSDGIVSVETKDGSRFEFDEIVITTPLGWLKNNLSSFEPPVPKRFQEAVESLGYGTLDKVYVTFPSAFWDRETDMSTTASTASSSREASPSSMQSVTTGFSNGDRRSINTYPSVTNFLEPPTPTPLTQEAISLSQLPSPHAHPTLLFYTTSRTTTHLSSLLPPKDSTPYTSNTPLSSPLAPFLTTYIPHLPNYHATHPACIPSAVLATNWAADELTGYGSYTFFPVGLERGDEDVRVLRRGMPERGVWVAGEHTAPFVALGTVTGAWWSGDAVARRILGLGEGEEGNDGVDGIVEWI
jgi:Flavin containing amine oxidoreductase